jgi:hypothetical protein
LSVCDFGYAIQQGGCLCGTVVPICAWGVLRLVSTQENYPWIGTDKKMFLCLVSSGLELMTLTQRKNALVRSNPRIIFLSGN